MHRPLLFRGAQENAAWGATVEHDVLPTIFQPHMWVLFCDAQKEAVRGATFDLLDSRQSEAFQHLPLDAYASLSTSDRQNIQAKVLELQRG